MLRFSIRDVLWLTVVVALCVALWLEHRSVVAERRSLQNERVRLEEEYTGLQRKRDLLGRSAAAVNGAILRQKKSEDATRP